MKNTKFIELFVSELTGKEYKVIRWCGYENRVEVILRDNKRLTPPKPFIRPAFEYNGERYIMLTEHERLKYTRKETDKGE